MFYLKKNSALHKSSYSTQNTIGCQSNNFTEKKAQSTEFEFDLWYSIHVLRTRTTATATQLDHRWSSKHNWREIGFARTYTREHTSAAECVPVPQNPTNEQRLFPALTSLATKDVLRESSDGDDDGDVACCTAEHQLNHVSCAKQHVGYIREILMLPAWMERVSGICVSVRSLGGCCDVATGIASLLRITHRSGVQL